DTKHPARQRLRRRGDADGGPTRPLQLRLHPGLRRGAREHARGDRGGGAPSASPLTGVAGRGRIPAATIPRGEDIRIGRRAGRIAAILFAGSVGAGVAHLSAQTTGGIEGVIRDSAGGALVDADLLVTSPSLQGARIAKSGAGGRFWFPALPPGTYSVTA